jgi:hypothetical protein
MVQVAALAVHALACKPREDRVRQTGSPEHHLVTRTRLTNACSSVVRSVVRLATGSGTAASAVRGSAVDEGIACSVGTDAVEVELVPPVSFAVRADRVGAVCAIAVGASVHAVAWCSWIGGSEGVVNNPSRFGVVVRLTCLSKLLSSALIRRPADRTCWNGTPRRPSAARSGGELVGRALDARRALRVLRASCAKRERRLVCAFVVDASACWVCGPCVSSPVASINTRTTHPSHKSTLPRRRSQHPAYTKRLHLHTVHSTLLAGRLHNRGWLPADLRRCNPRRTNRCYRVWILVGSWCRGSWSTCPGEDEAKSTPIRTGWLSA